ncbi:immunoglobulin-like domain-containing protein, partial [Clostridium sp. CAG:221]|uniref:immunoglobulin-like domain-containing protein n=1 Tax=Clostridium sp. CAG:221 TaxID=1262780 RepID=UPI000ACB6B4E
VDKDKSDSNSEESSSDENETIQDNKLKEEELGLDRAKFNAYIDKTDQLLFSIGFDEKEKKFTVSEQSEKNISEETPEETMYTIKIFDKEQKEKFSVELKGKDTGNSEKLEPLKSLNYEVGDFIQITPTDSKDVLKITGNIQGDVDKQKEDYSDGIDNYDYIGNVRFQVEEDHLKTVYNEAPVINGLTDIEESENPMNDILTGISIKDDHDGDIDNSKIVPLITELEDGVLDVSYTVEDSWGRKATGKRKISPKKVEQEEVKQEEPKIIREEINLRTGSSSSNTSQTATGLAANEITVEGTPYFNGQHVRFKIRFDTAAKQIQIADQDGRKLSNTGDSEYFKFVLYDKDMNEKASVSLLGNDKSDSDKLDKIANQLYEEGDYIGIWHAETKERTGDANSPENNPNSSSFIPKLKIAGPIKVLTNNGSGNLTESDQTKDYSNGMDKRAISERRFQIKGNGLKEVTNNAPVFENLDVKEIARGEEFDPLEGIKDKIKDDFDKFNDDNLETKAVSITYSSYDVKKVGNQTITYTATDKWGRSNTETRKLTVKSSNPLDTKYIEFKRNNEGNKGESLFKIKFDPVEKKFLVDNLDNIQDSPIDSSVSSSIFKLKVYTKGGVLQKTLNIKGTDNLKTVLKKFDGYKYNVGDRIELWSSTPKSIVIHGVDRDGELNGTVQQPSPSIPGQGSTENLPQTPNGEENSGETSENAPNGSGSSENNGAEYPEQNSREGNLTQSGNLGQSSNTTENDSDNYENYENGIDNTDFMKNVRFEIKADKLTYIYNKAPEFTVEDNVKLQVNRNGKLTRDKLMEGLTVKDDHDDSLASNVIIGDLDTTTIGEKEVEYRVVDSWGRSSLVKRKVTVYPYNDLEYNYINVKNNETNESILKIRFDDINKKLVVDKVDKSKIPSSLSNDIDVFEIKLIKKENINSKNTENNNNNVKTIKLTKKDLIDGNKVSEINNLSYKEFDYISLWVYDSKDGISVSKKPNLISNDQFLKNGASEEGSLDGILLNGFENQEKMQNTRFEIKSEGLEKIYNKGPEINGLNDILYVYKNDNIEKDYALKGVSVSSDIDKTISNEKIVITNVDNENIEDLDEEISTIGNFILKYTVTDSWGRSATYNRTVSVISKSVSNDIEFYNIDGNKKLFSLKYNPISNIFEVNENKVETTPKEDEEQEEVPPVGEYNPNEPLSPPTGNELNSAKSQQELQTINEELNKVNSDALQKNDSSNDNTEEPQKEIVFKLAIFNVDEEKVGEVELTEVETINIEEFKKKLSNITIYDGYYVSVWSNKPERIKIKGYMTGNNELGESGNVEIDYSNGTTDKDYIDNVRFNFTVDGINVVYNKAPKINFLNNETLTVYAGDAIDYTENIEVKDDRDNPENNNIIDKSKIKVSIIPPKSNNEGTQPDSNGSTSDSISGALGTETESNQGSENGSSFNSENIEEKGQTSNGGDETIINDEASSGSGDSGQGNGKNDVSNDKDNSNKTEEKNFLEEQKNNLRIGNNTVRLTVADSWGRESSIERSLIIKNGIDKNEIIFKDSNRQEKIRIGFNHIDNSLNVTTKNTTAFGSGDVPNYIRIKVYGKNGESKFEEITFNVNENPNSGNKLDRLKSYHFEYGDYFEIYHGHPNMFSITGGVNDQREDYTDGVQNPENLLNVKFEITKSGLKSIYTNPDEEKVNGNKVVFGPVAPEKFPFKIQIDFSQRKFKVVEATYTNILNGHNDTVYKMVLIGSDGRIKRQTTFSGNEDGDKIMSTTTTNNGNGSKNWNNQDFEYNDCLYIWHKQPERSIIKGTISKQREDYSDGVNDPDNMNHVVFRLTETGLESVYNEAPKISGVEDIDVYKGQTFNVGYGVTYTDDHDPNNLTKSVSLKENGMIRTITNTNNGNTGVDWNLDTSNLGEKVLVYTATDRWGKTTTVERKVTVRPNLYKNVFKVFAESENTSLSTKIIDEIEDNNLQPSASEILSTDSSGAGNTSTGESESETITPGGNTENDTRTPVFEIGFDSITRKYRVFNQSNEKLSKTNLDDEAFRIEIKDSDGGIKKKITLTGNDRGTSPKLSTINDINYADGDSIRVYRSDLKGIKITGTVTGHIPRTEDNMNETNKFDYMNNTRFIVSDAGLEAKYNKAPVMEGVKKVRTVSKGTIDLLEGINISDEEENISTDYMFIYVDDKLIGTVDNARNSNENSHKYYNFNKVGTYKVKYVLYDKWERATMIETTVKVESKVRENEIEVYRPDSTLAFRIAFDTKENKFVLKGSSEDSIVDKEEKDDNQEANNKDDSQKDNQEDENIETYSSESNSEKYFEMIVRDAKGNERKKVSLTGDTQQDSEQLNGLHQFAFNRYDTISLKARTAQAVKIKGGIVPEVSTKSTTTDYSNGFGTVEKYSEVRFKITDDGLREMTKKPLSINGADPIIIKRGDILDLLEGISVELNDQNNDDYKISVEEISSNSNKTVLLDETNNDNSSDSGVIEDKTKFKKLKEGVYTVRYTVTNSWGATTTVDREITVYPRTDLEAVKLTVKDYQGEDILIIGFDSITRKLRVIDYKNKSIDYLDNSQVFEINAFDSLGKTLGTIALRGNQEIDKSIIDRINAFPYEEGYSLSIWSKVIDNKIDITGSITTEKENSKEESKKSRYKRTLTLEEKRDKLENGRFKILSDGLKYIYNKAPVITGGDETIPYYKGNLLKAPSSLKINDDHDGEISTTEVTINDDNVDYDTLGEQSITYVVEDSWGRRATKPGKIEIRSAMDSNSINIYPKENSTASGSTSESIQQPNQSPENATEGETSQTRTTEAEGDSENTNHTPGAGGSVTEGTQTPAGSTDGSTETAPGENGGNSNQESSGEGDTTTPGDGNNIDNAVVKNSSFSIKFIRDNEHNKNRIKVDLGSKSKEQFDSSNAGTFLKVKIYDANGIALKSVDILGIDTGESAKIKIEKELNKVNSDSIDSKDETENEETEQQQTKTSSDVEGGTDSSINSANGSSQGGSHSTNKNDQKFEYFNGQYIAIEGVTEETKNSVKIQGTVVNKGNDVTYENGVSNLDKIQNVRFKFTDLGLEAVYNKAPTIKIDKDIKLDGTKRNTNSNVEENSPQDTRSTNTEEFDGIKGDDFNYLRGVTISDDHDTLTKDNVEVKWNEKFKDDPKKYNNNNEESALTDNNDGKFTLAGNGIKVYGEQNVGNNVLYYKVTDSWGRVSYEQRANIKLKNGAFEDNIKFGNSQVSDKLSLRFNKIENDTEGKVQLQLTTNENNKPFASMGANFKYYEIQVWVPNNSQSNEITEGYTNLKTLTLNGNQTPAQVSRQIQEFNGLQVPYGTILKIYAGHPQLFAIEGPVRDKLEDYSDKVQNPENLVDTVFKITEAGLKAIYVPTEIEKSLGENENLISLVAPEKIPLKIKISPNGSGGGSISVVDKNKTWLDGNDNSVVFKMTLKHVDGSSENQININGNMYADESEVLNQFNNLTYKFGDTLTISHKEPKKVLIKGKIGNAREDYSDGVDNSLNLTEAVFTLTKDGLVATYKSAPQIMGMIDIEVEKGKDINYEQLKQSVTAKDNIDGPITNIQYSAENIDTSKVGMYEFTYTVTNSNQRTTTKSSTITVYDKPTINKNNKATIELNSIENTENAIKDYLKTAVDVSDDDDKLYNKTTKVEVKSNDVNPNKAGTYHATYVATDLYGKTTEKKVDIQVVRTINVTVPTKLPFQVVTNLMPSENRDETTENDGFVSGVLKLKNNNTSPVKVSVASFGKKADSGELEIVDPNSCNWDNMNEQDSMTKMALGLYIKDNSLIESEYNTENKPLWLSTNKQNSDDTANPDSPGDSQEPSSRIGVNEDSNGDKVNEINTKIGILPAKETGSDKPKEASIGFTSKHGKNFIGGSVTGKFELTFKFE